MRLADAITFVRELRRYRYRSMKVSHPRGAFLRNALIKHATRAEFDEAVEAEKNKCGRMVWVEPDNLRAGQQCLAFTRLLKQLRRYPYPMQKLPIVVRLANGRYYIWDGHHRATAAIMLNGESRIRCLMVGSTYTEIPKNTPRKIELSGYKSEMDHFVRDIIDL